MSYCTSCGSPIPDGQGRSCSMCYGDVAHGRDRYYEQWIEEQLQKQQIEKEEEDKGECAECGKSWYFCICSSTHCSKCNLEWENCQCKGS